MEPITEFYVKDNDKNKIKLDSSLYNTHMDKMTNTLYNLNPFYFVECIAQWEKDYPLIKIHNEEWNKWDDKKNEK